MIARTPDHPIYAAAGETLQCAQEDVDGDRAALRAYMLDWLVADGFDSELAGEVTDELLDNLEAEVV